jgi:hypothetical protein
MVRLTKFFKLLQFKSDYDGESKEDTAAKVSAKMGVVLSQRVALLIMTLVVIDPFLTADVKDFSGTGFLLNFDEVARTDAFSSSQWGAAVSSFSKFYRVLRLKEEVTIAEPVWLKVRGIPEASCPASETFDHFSAEWQLAKDGSGLCRYDFDRSSSQGRGGIIRQYNKRWATSSGHARYDDNRQLCSANAPEFSFVCDRLERVDVLFDSTSVAVEDAWLSIALICVVIFLLVAFSATFAVAVDSLVVKPIARIMSNLKQSAEVVLASVQLVVGDDNEEDEIQDMTEAELLELLVKKLAQIVHKSTGDKMKELLKADGGQMDKKTTEWLSEIYSEEHAQDQVIEGGGGWSQLWTRVIDTSLPVDEAVLNSFSFDVFSLDQGKLIPCVRFMFERYQLPKEFDVSSEVLEEWMIRVMHGYKDLPYHGWYHGVDVLHTVYLLLDKTRASEYMTKLEFFALLVAALAHDIGHPGVNNGFLVKTKHELALLHNDASPLENMHAGRLFETFQDPKSNLLANLSEVQWQACRRQMLACILNTDMANHFSNLKTLEMLEEVNGPFIRDFLEKRPTQGEGASTVPDCLKDAATRLHIQEALLHAGTCVMPQRSLYVGECT